MDLELRALLLNAISPTALRKKKRDTFLRKSSNQNVFHMLMERFLCVYLFISKFTIFLFP